MPNKTDIIYSLTKRNRMLRNKDILEFVNAFFTIIKDSLLSYNKVVIRDIGVFTITSYTTKERRYYKLHFRVGKHLYEMIND